MTYGGNSLKLQSSKPNSLTGTASLDTVPQPGFGLMDFVRPNDLCFQTLSTAVELLKLNMETIK
jgi:hypothetical protein